MGILSKFKGVIIAAQSLLSSIYVHYGALRNQGWGNIGKNSFISTPSIISGKNNIYIGDNVHIDWDCVLYATNAKFVMGNNSAAAVGLKVITGNHQSTIGKFYMNEGNRNLKGSHVIVEDDVWIGASVTLLAGTRIGRGSTIGAGSVIADKNVPPYAITMGNPAKVIGFRFTPEEIIEHEKALYSEEERLPLELLEKNYEKYFLKRLKEIKEYTRL